LPGRLETGRPAQADVDQHDVRLQRPDALDGLGGGAGYSGDRHPIPLQQRLRRVEKRLVVIDYHAPQLHRASLPARAWFTLQLAVVVRQRVSRKASTARTRR